MYIGTTSYEKKFTTGDLLWAIKNFQRSKFKPSNTCTCIYILFLKTHFRQISLFVVLSALLKQIFFSIYVFKSSKMWGTYRRCQFYLFTDIKDSLFVLFLLLEKSYHVQRKLSIWQQTGFSFCVNSIHNQFVQPELKNTT